MAKEDVARFAPAEPFAVDVLALPLPAFELAPMSTWNVDEAAAATLASDPMPRTVTLLSV